MDKRADERLAILGELHGEIMVFQPMLVTELGAGGATVETRFPLHIDSLHDLRLTLGALSLVLKARVVHSKISDVDQDIVTYRSGMEFVALTERASSMIAGFVESLRTDRTGV